MKRKMLFLLVLMMLSALFVPGSPALQEQAVTRYENADWGIAMDMPAGWLYQAGTLPPAADRPFAPRSDTLSSRDTFYVGLWATDDSFAGAPGIRLSVYYTSAGTVERIAGVQDRLMEGLIAQFAETGRAYEAGAFEILACGEKEAAVLSMRFTQNGKEYLHWNFLLPFPMTMFQFEGIAEAGEAQEMKLLLQEMVASFVAE